MNLRNDISDSDFQGLLMEYEKRCDAKQTTETDYEYERSSLWLSAISWLVAAAWVVLMVLMIKGAS